MSEKHKAGQDGVLNDGVSYYSADAHDLQSYRDAQEALSRLPMPVFVHSENPHERLFVAAFDGTGNDVDEDPEHRTSIARVSKQIREMGRSQIGVGYVPGPGTQDNPISRAWDGMRGHTYDERLEEMYKQFIDKVKKWRDEDPNVEVRIADIGFSRGAEQAAGFARLVHERGIQDASGAKYTYDADGQIKHVEYTKPPLVAPGQVAQAVGLFDPVGTGEPVDEKDRRLPSSVISGFQIIAEDERRGLFKSSHIIDPGMTSDGRFLGVVVGGAHSDIGGSYHRDGLGVRSGNLMVDYINSLSDKPFLQKRTVQGDPRLDVVHRSEEGMWLYRAGPKIDRLASEGYEPQLVPDRLRRQVSDPDNAEPRDEALSRQFERRPVSIGPVPVSSEQRTPQIRDGRAPLQMQGSAAAAPKTRTDPLFDQLYRASISPNDGICREDSRSVVGEYLGTPNGQCFQLGVKAHNDALDAQERQAALEAQLWQMEQAAQQQAAQPSRGVSR